MAERPTAISRPEFTDHTDDFTVAGRLKVQTSAQGPVDPLGSEIREVLDLEVSGSSRSCFAFCLGCMLRPFRWLRPTARRKGPSERSRYREMAAQYHAVGANTARCPIMLAPSCKVRVPTEKASALFPSKNRSAMMTEAIRR